MKDNDKKEVVRTKEDGTTETIKVGKRTPVFQQKANKFKARPGFKPYQVVEKPGRVEQFLEAGYTMCRDQQRIDTDGRLQDAKGLGDICRQVVNRHNLQKGDAATAVWMEIPEELYNQDQQEKLKRAQQAESEIDPHRLAEQNPDIYYGAKFKKIYE